MKKACGDAHMKSILAIGELGSMENVYKVKLWANKTVECEDNHTKVLISYIPMDIKRSDCVQCIHIPKEPEIFFSSYTGKTSCI